MKTAATVLLLALCGVATITTTEAKRNPNLCRTTNCECICTASCSGAGWARYGKLMQCYEDLPVCKRTGDKKKPWSVSGKKNDYRACRQPSNRDEAFEENFDHENEGPFYDASVVQYNPYGSYYKSHGPTNWEQARHFQSWNNHDENNFDESLFDAGGVGSSSFCNNCKRFHIGRDFMLCWDTGKPVVCPY